MALFSCTKSNYEEIVIEQELTEPEIVFLTDCEELNQNIGDTCFVDVEPFGEMMGFVTEECVCDADLEGEQVTIAFHSQLPWNTHVFISSSPAFLAGQSEVLVGPGMSLLHFLFPEETAECTFEISYGCPGGLMSFPNITFSGSPINGAVGPLEIEC